MLAAVLIAAFAGPAADVSLRRAASVSGAAVTLGEVAYVSGPAGETAALSALVLAPAPTSRGVIDLPTVRRRLEAAGLWTPGVTLSGAARCVVTRRDERPALVSPPSPSGVLAASVAAARAKLKTAVTERLQTAFPGRAFEVDIRLRASDADAVVASAMAGDVRLSGGSADLTRPQLLTIAGDPPVTFEATVTERSAVLVAAVTLPRGTVVTAGHLTASQDAAAPDGVSDAAQLLGKELRRSVPAGRPIRPRDVRTVQLVRTGAVVTVSVRMPGLSVARQMKSRGAGGLGDVIQCVSLDARQTVAATITGLNEAVVAAPPAGPQELRDAGGAVIFEPGETP